MHNTTTSASLDYCHKLTNPYLHQFSSISGRNCITLLSIHYRPPTHQLQNVTLNYSFIQSHYNYQKIMDYKPSAKQSKASSSCPLRATKKQIDETNRDIVLKKLSNELIPGKTTESTAMELDAEGGASFEQLQDLIKKECDKRDKNYHSLEQQYNKLQASFEQSQQKSSKMRGQGGASNKKKPSQTTARRTQQQCGRSTSKRRMQTQGPRQPNQSKGKADDTNNVISNENGRNSVRRRRSRSQPKKKPSSIDWNKSRLQSRTK